MEKNPMDFFKSIKEPRFITAPMVDQSELAFRMLTRRHGAQLCYTPMLHSRLMVEDKSYMPNNFTTCPEDRPLFVQFCANDPKFLLEAAKMVEPYCDAVDLNFGCPQGIARKGNYGAFLLSQPEIMRSCIEVLAKNLKIPVTAKMRILPNEEDTLKLAKMIQEAGASLLTVHGRTKEQNKQYVGPCNWDIIKKIKQTLTIPVIANGGIYTYEDAMKCLEYTGCNGVMSSEAILENPALFSGPELKDMDDMAEEYLELAQKHNTDPAIARPHIFKILHAGLAVHKDLREQLATAHEYSELIAISKELKERRKGESKDSKLGWYKRYWAQYYIPPPEWGKEALPDVKAIGTAGTVAAMKAASGTRKEDVMEETTGPVMGNLFAE